MAETLLKFQLPVLGTDGRTYEARACGADAGDGTWQGWIEFVPMDGRDPVRSPRETTQPNRDDTVYWATGLTPVYLEGALQRAMSPQRAAPAPARSEPSIFDGPEPPPPPRAASVVDAALDPFSVYEKGEPLLRKQLGALSPWHLVNIVRAYELSTASEAVLSRRPAAALIEEIVAAVRAQAAARHAR